MALTKNKLFELGFNCNNGDSGSILLLAENLEKAFSDAKDILQGGRVLMDTLQCDEVRLPHIRYNL